MRRFLLFFLFFSFLATAPLPALGLPRGDGNFTLGMTRGDLMRLVRDEGREIVSDRAGFLAATSADTLVEFEQYVFLPTADGRELLWKATFAYRMPSTVADFEAIARRLKERLGEPSEVDVPADDVDGRTHRIAWVDGSIAVRLAGRWPEEPDPLADRMLVTWVDRRLEKSVVAQLRKSRKPRS